MYIRRARLQVARAFLCFMKTRHGKAPSRTHYDKEPLSGPSVAAQFRLWRVSLALLHLDVTPNAAPIIDTEMRIINTGESESHDRSVLCLEPRTLVQQQQHSDG